MTHSELQTRAVQSLVRRADEFRNHLLSTSGSSGGFYHYGNSISYGSWELMKLFADSRRITDEVRTMEDITRYMTSHREHEFYCMVELAMSLNSVFDALARTVKPAELYGSTEKVLAAAVKTLQLGEKTLSYKTMVDFQYARFLVLHAARLLHEAGATLSPGSEDVAKGIELARHPLAAAVTALENNTDAAATSARQSVVDALTQVQALVA